MGGRLSRMGKIKAVLASPYTAAAVGVGALLKPFFDAGPNGALAVLKGWNLFVFAVSVAWVFVAQQVKIYGLERYRKPKAALMFDHFDVKCVQKGGVDCKVGEQTYACDEYRYAIGVISLSTESMAGCRLLLSDSSPHHTSQQRLERPMLVRGEVQNESTGEFTLPPRDLASPSLYVEVFQEVVPPAATDAPSTIRCIYASTRHAQARQFDRKDHGITFRLQGPMSQAITFRLSVRYDDSARRWIVRPAQFWPQTVSSRLGSEDASSDGTPHKDDSRNG